MTQTDTRPEHSLHLGPIDETGDFCREDVHNWFGLTYSSYLVLPRSLLQEMPPAWQHELVMLLERMREEFPGEHSEYMVQKRGDNNRFVSDPLRNYRYPDPTALAAARTDPYARPD